MIREACPTLAPQRREHIRLLVRESGIARVEDLRRELKVSVATIRRDLEVLEEEGKVRRVHGGAVMSLEVCCSLGVVGRPLLAAYFGRCAYAADRALGANALDITLDARAISPASL